MPFSYQEVLECFADAADRSSWPEKKLTGFLIQEGLNLVGDGDRGWRRSAVNQEFRARRGAARPLCPGCGVRPAAESAVCHGKLPVFCSRKCGAAYRARQRYQKLSDSEFAASQEKRVARVREVTKARWAAWRAETDQEARWARKRALAAARQRRYRARKIANG